MAMKTRFFLLLIAFYGLSSNTMAQSGVPLTDYHVHLKGDFTYDKAVEHSARTGIKYGVAVNCGIGFPVQTDSAALAWLVSMKNSPFYLAMQAEGREWLSLFSPAVIQQFDYVFTDAMTYTDASGKRVRLWINEEVSVPDKQLFMDDLVSRIVTIISHEPIDIYVNPTFLPEVISAEYDHLWTTDRMMKVIESAVKHQVAIEINNRYRIPSEKFIRLARQHGAKFAFGTNNTDSQMGDLDYCLDMVKKCGLTADDLFVVKK
jgi:hypothetical protein